MNDLVIETQDLTKRYDGFVAVDSLNLAVKQGEVFGVLGPNGAGKTTTILMLLGLTEPTAGSVRVVGFDPTRQPLSVKSCVGYIPEQVGFYEHLTARENLVYITKLNGVPRDEAYRRIDEALARVGLSDVSDQAVKTFSRGMRQRLGVADVLVKRPKLIIMDEPTQGLDPEQAQKFLQMIRVLQEEGTTILLASHLLHQVQAVCDRVGLFHQGRMVLEGTVADLARRVLGGACRIYLQVEKPTVAIAAALRNVAGVLHVRQSDDRTYEMEAEYDVRADVAQAAVEAGGRLLALDVRAQNLDQIYTEYFEEVEHHDGTSASAAS
ncbi:MAG: ABC transporter ATP-binding protein [Chloroflexi bacterium]|nr:MAG: ABC transporter ATP-binding protein [Chloroflexota bacterium]